MYTLIITHRYYVNGMNQTKEWPVMAKLIKLNQDKIELVSDLNYSFTSIYNTRIESL